MNVTTVMLFDEQRDTLMAAATSAREQARTCAMSLRLLPLLQAEYRARAAALGNAIAALDVNAQPGNLATELRELQEQHARLQRQLDDERARGGHAGRRAAQRAGAAGADCRPGARRGGTRARPASLRHRAARPCRRPCP